jgi:hypothetical protein
VRHAVQVRRAAARSAELSSRPTFSSISNSSLPHACIRCCSSDPTSPSDMVVAHCSCPDTDTRKSRPVRLDTVIDQYSIAVREACLAHSSRNLLACLYFTCITLSLCLTADTCCEAGSSFGAGSSTGPVVGTTELLSGASVAYLTHGLQTHHRTRDCVSSSKLQHLVPKLSSSDAESRRLSRRLSTQLQLGSSTKFVHLPGRIHEGKLCDTLFRRSAACTRVLSVVERC